jgi:hypothetical protein
MRPRPLHASRRFVALSSAAFSIAGLAWLAWIGSRTGVASIRESARTDGVSGGAQLVESGVSRAADAPEANRARGSDGRTVASSSGVLVRVLDRRSGEPVEGFVVSMIEGESRGWGLPSAERLLGEEPTDARGEIRFPAPKADARIRLYPPYGWSAGELVRSVEFRENGRYDDVVVLTGPADHGRFRGRFVDASNGEPVPHYMARVTIGESTREVVSGADGRFSTDDELPAGEAKVVLFDWGGLMEDEDILRHHGVFVVEHAPVDGVSPELEIPAAVGPTYRIDAEFPAGVPRERWAADLVVRGNGGWTPRLQTARGAPLRWGLGSWAGPWVRFRRQYFGLEDGFEGSKELVVTSADGEWLGRGTVATLAGIAPDPVPVEFDPRGRIVARIVDSSGEPIPRADVSCEMAGPVASSVPLIFSQSSSGNGLVEFVLLPAGAYIVGASSQLHGRRLRAVELRDAQRVDLELMLAEQPRGREVAGRVFVPAEMDLIDVTVALEGVRPSGLRMEQQLPLVRTGDERSASFRFTDVSPGDLAVVVRGLRSRGTWSAIVWTPRRVEISGSATDLVFRASTDPRRCRFEAVDAKTKDELPCDVSWFADGTWQCWEGVDAEEMFAPSQVELWRIHSPGYLARDVVTDWSADPVVVRAELERGWGLEVLAVGPGLVPLEGVEVLVDAESAGKTDAEGRLVVRREHSPRSIAARYSDWYLESNGRLELLRALEHGRACVRLIFSPD